jgi:Tol biopolymer transport system component
VRALSAVAAVLVALAVVPAAHEAGPPGGKIVYESYSDGDLEIYATDPETHAVLKLTNDTVEDSSPTPLPDGTKAPASAPSWSPDGSTIANVGDDGVYAIARTAGT